MILDSMIQRGGSAGHTDEGPLPRMATTESRLRSKVEDWLRYVCEKKLTAPEVLFALADREFEKETIRVPELEASIMSLAEHPAIVTAGMLLSVAYQKDPCQDFKYALTTPIPLNYVGMWLPPEKSLYVASPVGEQCYSAGSGILILGASAGRGVGTRGNLVVNKTTLDNLPQSDLTINTGIFKYTPADNVSNRKLLIDFGLPHNWPVEGWTTALIAWPETGVSRRVIQHTYSKLIIATKNPLERVSEPHKEPGLHVPYTTVKENAPLMKLINDIGAAARANVSECVAYLRSFGQTPGSEIELRISELIGEDKYVK